MNGFDAFVGNPPIPRGKAHQHHSRRPLQGMAGSPTRAIKQQQRHRRAFLSAHVRPPSNRTRRLDCLRQTQSLKATHVRRACVGFAHTAASSTTRRSATNGKVQPQSSRVSFTFIASRPVRLRSVSMASAFHVSLRFSFTMGATKTPRRSRRTPTAAFVGSYILGMGFTFDDDNEDATPLARMHTLVGHDPRNAERIFPYLGGDELNTSPTHAHRRFVINFAQMTESKAREWPDLMDIVETKVKPQRLRAAPEVAKFPWWQFWNARKNLYDAIKSMDRVLAIARVSDSFALTFIPSKKVFSEQLCIFAFDSFAAFAVLQSRVHERWARFFASTMGDGLRYGPTDCFETFPFPSHWQENVALEDAGRTYFEFRASLMIKANEGLTTTYNRFHDPDNRADDIVTLRRLHDAIDRAVLDCYGWPDVCGEPRFLVDRAEDDEGDAGKAKMRWRLRWSDDVRDDVLARLLALNVHRSTRAPIPGLAKVTKGVAARRRKRA